MEEVVLTMGVENWAFQAKNSSITYHSQHSLVRTYVRRMLPICVSTSSIYSIHPFSPLLVRGKFGSQNSIFDHSSSLIVSPCFLRTLLAIGDRLQSREIVEESFEMQQPYLKLADYDHQLMQIHIHPPSPVSTNYLHS